MEEEEEVLVRDTEISWMKTTMTRIITSVRRRW